MHSFAIRSPALAGTKITEASGCPSTCGIGVSRLQTTGILFLILCFRFQIRKRLASGSFDVFSNSMTSSLVGSKRLPIPIQDKKGI